MTKGTQQDYRERILEVHRKLQAAYDDSEKQRERLTARLQRLGERYDWGHISKETYWAKHEEIQSQLRELAPVEEKGKNLDRLAHFLASIADAWEEANQEQRNQLTKTLFEEIQVKDNKVVAVKPRPELEPFFKLNLECHSRDMACDPEGSRVLGFKLFVDTWPLPRLRFASS